MHLETEIAAGYDEGKDAVVLRVDDKRAVYVSYRRKDDQSP